MQSNLIGYQVLLTFLIVGDKLAHFFPCNLIVLFFLLCEASLCPALGCEEMKSAPRFLAHAVDKRINILFKVKVRPPSASSFIYESASTVIGSCVHQSSRC